MLAQPGLRHEWMDYAKGLCIIAVVLLYATEHVSPAVRGHNWVEFGVEFARPFRMPDFFFISGLLLARVIDRPWRPYADKKVVHYLYFFAVWSLLYFAARLAGGKAGQSLPESAGEFVKVMTYGPFAMLWFVQMLPLYLVLTKLLRRVPWWIVLPLAALWHMAPIDTDWSQVDRAGQRFVFFFGGYLFAEHAFRVARWAAMRPPRTLAALAVWAMINGAMVFGGISNHPLASLLLGFMGAFGVIAIAALLHRARALDWVRLCGEQSLPIYVGFLFPLAILTDASLAVAGALALPVDAGSLSLLMAAASIAIALFACEQLRHTRLAWLYERPAWAHLVPPKALPPVPAAPAQTEASEAASR